MMVRVPVRLVPSGVMMLAFIRVAVWMQLRMFIRMVQSVAMLIVVIVSASVRMVGTIGTLCPV